MFKKLAALALLSFVLYVVVGGLLVQIPKILTFEVINAIQALP